MRCAFTVLPNPVFSELATKDFNLVNWNAFNLAPAAPRDRVDTSAMPDAKPIAPKGDENGEKFARALKDDQPKERAQATPPAPKPAPEQKTPMATTPQGKSTTNLSAPSAGKDVAPREDDKPLGLPKELEALIKSSAPDAAPETLALVANLLLQGGPIKDNVPVLAVLTGDFSNLSAKEIPAVVLKSPFVAKALASDGVGDFLQTKLTLSELLGSLNIDQPTIDGLQQSGVNLEERVTPRKLLHALGIDTQTLQAELQNLKGNLQLEGLKSYIDRAKKLGLENTSPMAPSAKPRVDAIEIPVVATAPQTTTAEGVPLEIAPPGRASAQEPLAMPQDLGVMEKPSEETQPRARLVEHSPFDALGEEMAHLPSTKLVADRPAAPAPIAQPTTGSSSLIDGTPQPESKERPVIDTAMFSPPMESEASASHSQKSFAFLGDPLGTKTKAEIAVPEIPAATVLPSEQAAAPAEAGSKPAAPAHMTMSVDELMARLQKPGERANAQPATMMATDAVTGPAFEGQKESFDKQEDQTAEDSPQAPEISLSQRNDAAGMENVHKTKFTTEILDVAKPAQIAETREKIHQSVFDHATMMLDEGGGSIRIDLGGKDMGVLDLAVNVRNDQLDLRIIASSENVREILTQDIPRLKDSLSQQHLQLRNVEIAVGQSGAWAGQSGSSFRDSRQKFSAPRDEKVGEISRAGTFSARSRSYIPNTRSPQTTHAGRIQVLV